MSAAVVEEAAVASYPVPPAADTHTSYWCCQEDTWPTLFHAVEQVLPCRWASHVQVLEWGSQLSVGHLQWPLTLMTH